MSAHAAEFLPASINLQLPPSQFTRLLISAVQVGDLVSNPIIRPYITRQIAEQSRFRLRLCSPNLARTQVLSGAQANFFFGATPVHYRPCKKPLLSISMDNTELEGRPRHPLMLKEWLELEYSAELSRDGFGCYPRHLATDPRSGGGCRRRRNGDVIARVSAAVRAALSRPPSARARQRKAAAAALPRSRSTRLRVVVGFWKKRSGEVDRHRPVPSCSATAASSGRRDDGASSPAATSPRRLGRESRQTGGHRAGLGGGRRSHETVAEGEGCECEATCHLDEEREQEQRLSPVSVMDFQSLDVDGDDDCNDNGGCDGHSEDEGTSPTFERSLASIRRASQQLLDRIRRFEQLAELDTSDVDDAATTADDTSCRHVGELDNEDAERGPVQRDLPGLPEASSPCAAAHCFEKLLEDFFREGLSLSSCHAGGSDGSDLEMALLETAKAWLDGRYCCAALRSDQKAVVEEIERLVRWRRFGEDERELLSYDVEGGIFCYLMEELVDDLC